MKHPELIRQKKQLDFLFNEGAKLAYDPELQAHWTLYLCIRVSGFLENSVRIVFSEYARTGSHQNIANFVENNLRRIPNPSMDYMFALSEKFSPAWKADLKQQTSGQLRASVDSIVTNRNAIAHGASSTLTYRELHSYYQDAVKVIEILENNCK
jgi:hypothetical protein